MKVVGEMEDVLIQLSANEKICQYIDIVVADIPYRYGLILSRDWSHLWLPHKGIPNQIKILREPYMKHTVTKLEERNEWVNSVLGNYLIELELGHSASKEASNLLDTHPNLLQYSQADKIDCKSVDVVFVSRTIELDNG